MQNTWPKFCSPPPAIVIPSSERSILEQDVKKNPDKLSDVFETGDKHSLLGVVGEGHGCDEGWI